MGLENVTNNMNKPSFDVIIELVLTPSCQLADLKRDDKDLPQVGDHSAVPTFNSVLDVLKSKDGIDLETLNRK